MPLFEGLSFGEKIMLTEPQKYCLTEIFVLFFESLDDEQRGKYYSLLDDLIQYDKAALPLAYHVTSKLMMYKSID